MVQLFKPEDVESLSHPFLELPGSFVAARPVGTTEIDADMLSIDNKIPAAQDDSDGSVCEIFFPNNVLVPEEASGEGMCYTNVFGCEIVKPVFIRVCRLAVQLQDRISMVGRIGSMWKLTKLYATSGRCSKNVTGSTRMTGPIFFAMVGVCKRWVETTLP